jgi:hypothetical protein
LLISVSLRRFIADEAARWRLDSMHQRLLEQQMVGKASSSTDTTYA